MGERGPGIQNRHPRRADLSKAFFLQRIATRQQLQKLGASCRREECGNATAKTCKEPTGGHTVTTSS